MDGPMSNVDEGHRGGSRDVPPRSAWFRYPARMSRSPQRMAYGAGVCVVMTVALQACSGSAAQREPSGTVLAEDAYLRNLVGEWSIERSIRGKVVGNRMSVESALGGAFVRLHMESTTPSDPYEAIVLVGFDTTRGEYVAHWCDSFGPAYSAIGHGKRDGQRLELRFDYPSGPFFNTWEYDPAADRWTFTGESGAASRERTLFARDVVTRVHAR